MTEPARTSCRTVGWVLDQATSQRRIHVTVWQPGVVTLTVEVYGQQNCVVELDEDGALILRGLLGQALQRARVEEDV
jgi:hypothetical protein